MQLITADRQRIDYDIVGSGPRLLTVDPALGSSAMRPLQASIDVLAEHFEVVTYDRRGRGGSVPVSTLSADAEMSDLLAVVEQVGAPAAVLGFSSGGAVVLHAAAQLRDTTLVLLEPAVDLEPDTSGLEPTLRDAIEGGRLEDAVRAFYDATGVPDEILTSLAASDAWPSLVSSAPTLLADVELAYVPASVLASIHLPVHLVVSDGSPEEITGMSDRLAAELVGARLWREPGGWHGVEPEALTYRLRTLVAGDSVR